MQYFRPRVYYTLVLGLSLADALCCADREKRSYFAEVTLQRDRVSLGLPTRSCSE